MSNRLLIVGITVLAAARFASAQSLAETAEKDKAKRAKAQESGVKAKTLTDDDLKNGSTGGHGTYNVGTGTVTAKDNYPTAPQTARGSGDAAKAKPSAPADDLRSQEEAWRARAQAARARLAEAEKHYAYVAEKSKTHDLTYKSDHSADTAKVVADAKVERDLAQKALQDLEEEARRAFVPPGWLR
jgi:hypothetical protein